VIALALACTIFSLALQPAPGSASSELPSLDELLGLPSRPGAAKDTSVEDLDKALGREVEGDLLKQASELMQRSSARLADSKDAGIQTQRLQEDAVKKLDALIAQAQKNQQKKPKKQKQEQSQQQQQQQQQQSQQAQASKSAAQQDHAGPARQDGPLKEAQAASGATWGNLPPYLRDALRQGSSDRYSTLYQQLTEQYYKRLAEEPKK
jgi:hypothetical protein